MKTMCSNFLLVLMFALYFHLKLLFIVRSDQGGSRNLFSDANTKLSNVTLVIDDQHHFRAHKG